MSHFGLSTTLLRYNEHDDRSVADMLSNLRGGKNLALVSDGGLPGISDPGWKIVAAARKENIPVTALPGGAAVTTALAGSGLPADSFVFLGFLPRSAGKQKKVLLAAAALGRTIAIYESPFRVVDLLNTAASVLGGESQACVVRELSKLHEEWLRGDLKSVHDNLAARKELLGEFVVMILPSGVTNADNESDTNEHVTDHQA
jgi:16S rRNA (cytidine1402-2'-O)-methyltransferase